MRRQVKQSFLGKFTPRASHSDTANKTRFTAALSSPSILGTCDWGTFAAKAVAQYGKTSTEPTGGADGRTGANRFDRVSSIQS